MINFITLENIAINYFCNTEASIGEALFKISSDRDEVASIKHAMAGAILVGISLNNIVERDLSKYNLLRDTILIGSKVQILKKGSIVISLPLLEIPCGQPLYINQDGQITWKYSIYRVGTTISNQDKSGYVKALIQIDGI